MLNSILIENYKCFKKQYIPLANITLFTGFNAAGKSTTIQAILLASQLANESNQSLMALNGAMVKLGTVGDVLCRFANEKTIRFEYATDNRSLLLTLDATERSRSHLSVTNPAHSTQTLTDLFGQVIYISALRQPSLDVYPSPEKSEPVYADVGDYGQFAPWWFHQYADDDIDKAKAKRSEKSLTLRRQFIAWINDLFPGSEANTVAIERTPLIRLELRMSGQEDWTRPSNIGYGLTYAFPIIIAGLLAKKGQILIIDSPEAHLHPMGQSKIGYFLGVIAAAGVQVVLETHSDHVLNGLRIAVAKKAICPHKVAIHFFNPVVNPQSDTDSHALPHIISPQIDTDGNLSEWPQGFFDQSDKDLAALSGWE